MPDIWKVLIYKVILIEEGGNGDRSPTCQPGTEINLPGSRNLSLVLTEFFFTDNRRSSVGVGVLGSLIYAVGGYDGNSRQCLASVEVYIPEQDAWKRVADMSARR